MHRHGGLQPVRSASTSIFRIIAILATVMIGIFTLWELAENALHALEMDSDLTLFYLIRGISTAIIMSALAAWLMLRYRWRFERLLRDQSMEAHRMRLFFENIVQDAGEGIVTFDRNGRILSWNRAAEVIYGYTAEEMIGGGIDPLLPPELREESEGRRLTETVAEKGAVRNFETRRIRKDGTPIIVEITRSALHDGAGRLIGSTAMVHDITSEKEMEVRLIQAEKLAAIGQAAATIAHEVRNALAGISGAVQVLKGTPAWKELPEEFADEFDLQVSRIAHIVQDLLSYARPGTLNTDTANLRKLVERALGTAECSPEAGGKKIQRRFAHEAIFVRVDAGRLEQAFTNIITNALQAMEKGGTLTVSTERTNGAVRVVFQDTGPGMSPGTVEKAFDPFYTTKVRGTGLGLNIVKNIVEAHNGSVDLVSEHGSGTKVMLTLPAESAERTKEEKRMLKSPSAKLAAVMIIAFLGLTGGLLLAEGPQFVGASKCKLCHMSEYKTWEASPHSGAFETLKPEDQKNEECLSCHTTGHGQPAASGAELKGVQCEACHGPGSEYKSMKIMSKKAYKADPEAAHQAALEAGLVIPTEETCKSCHNEKSPTFKGFDFASAKEKIKHWE